MDKRTEGLLESRYPNLAFMLRLMEKESKEKGTMTLHSQEEIEKFDVLYIYGLVADKGLQNWLAGKGNRDLIFLEDEIGGLRRFLEQDIAKEILSNPRIEIRFNSDRNRQSDFLAECAREYPCENVEVLAIDERRGPAFDQMRFELLRLTTVQHAFFIESLHYHQIFKNLLPNFHQFPHSFFANKLQGQFRGIPAVICGAGPSLCRDIEPLRGLENRALMIAGGSAVTALNKAQIRPHLEMAMDPNPEEYERFKHTTSGDIPLIYNTRLFPSVFETRTGPLGYLQSGTGGSAERWMEDKLRISPIPMDEGFDTEALSVITAAIQFAVTLGCGPIIFVGVDLAFTDQKTYAAGVKDDESIDPATSIAMQRVVRPDIYGYPVETQVKWVMESESIGKYAKAHPSTTFLNATSGGIGFPGIENRSLSEISLIAKGNMRDRVKRAIEGASLEVKSEDVSNALEVLKESFKKGGEYIQEALAELNRIESKPCNPETGKMILIQMELEGLEAYHCCLQEQSDALEFVLGKKYHPKQWDVLEEQRWKRKYHFLKEKWSSLHALTSYYLEILHAGARPISRHRFLE